MFNMTMQGREGNESGQEMSATTLTKWWAIEIFPKETSAMQEFLAYNPKHNNNLLTKVIMLLDVNVQSVVLSK